MDEVTRLIEELKARDADVRRSAAKELGEIGHPDAIPALIAALKDKDSHVCGRAEWALWKIGPAAVPALSKALKDKQGHVCGRAAWALGKIGPSAISALTEALNDKDVNVRIRAAHALKEIASHDAAPALRAAVPTLRRRLRERTHDPKEETAYADVLERIERTTAGLKQLPLTAAAPVPSNQSLPVIAAASVPASGDSLPIPSAPAVEDRSGDESVSLGALQRLRRLFRGSGGNRSDSADERRSNG